MNVLVTGASGFVGQALCQRLTESGYSVSGVLRRISITGRVAEGESILSEVRLIPVEDIGPETHWDAALEGVDTLVHLAARVHVQHDPAPEPILTSTDELLSVIPIDDVIAV